MGNKATTELDYVISLANSDDILVNASGKTARIKYSNFSGKLNDWSSIANKPFDKYNADHFKIENQDNNVMFSLNDNVISSINKSHAHENKTVLNKFSEDADGNILYNSEKIAAVSSWADLTGKPFTGLGAEFAVRDDNLIVSDIFQKAVFEYKHQHNNMSVLNCFTVTDEKLYWKNILISEAYSLPVATTTALGGVKPDGTTITVDTDGTIHGANTYTLPTATSQTLGGVKPDGVTITVTEDGTVTSLASKGDKGDKGDPGNNGISPTASVIQTESGATVTVTDGSGTTTANISNGTDGVNGTNGIDGITPHIDETSKNWFIGETDTGVNAEGIVTVTTSAVTLTGTLLASGWSDSAPYTQTIAIDELGDSNPILDLVISDDVTIGIEQNRQWGYVTRAVASKNSLTVYCYEKVPTVDLNIMLKVV